MQQDYPCVSTYGQTLDAQLEQLRREGCAKVFREKASGAQADRRQLLQLLKGLTRGDVVIVTRIDRLARSTPAAQRAEARRRRFEGQPSRNWQTATTWAERRFHGLRYKQCVAAALVGLVEVTGDFCSE
jgi:hypothetical protein